MSTRPLTRREMLQRGSLGFGSVALAGLLQNQGRTQAQLPNTAMPSSAALSRFHHLPRAKHVIFCFMSGGVSHVDSFDPKPLLKQYHGQPMPVSLERTQFNNNGNVMASPFDIRQHGESGIAVSSLFPHIAKVADELAVVRSMTSPVNEHAQGNFFIHTGFPFMGYPSAGAWTAYGLGTENQDLPAYVVLQSGNASAPHGGISLFSNGFLPAQHQGSILAADRDEAIRNVRPLEKQTSQRRRLDFIQNFDQDFLKTTQDNSQVEAAIQNAEVAFRMQSAVPELCEISGETQATRDLYGVDSTNPQLAGYARQCLLARRLVERGVRFVELSCLARNIGGGNAANPWDQHGQLKLGHEAMAHQVDQPIAALVQDLRSRGLLDETLIVWAGEFGRTPFSQGSDGRDHNPMGFTIWMAGGGTQGGTVYGATDDFGYRAVDNPSTIYDLWATVLHQLGVNHEKLTYRYGGRDFRLTDVHGTVLKPILKS